MTPTLTPSEERLWTEQLKQGKSLLQKKYLLFKMIKKKIAVF
jgi:hypothetical protein